MRKLLTILILGLLSFHDLTPSFYFLPVQPLVVPGEYYTMAMHVGGADNGQLYQIIGNAQLVAGIPGMVNFSAGAHGWAAVDSTTMVWTQSDNNQDGVKGNGTFGSGSYSPFKILTDSAGNAFNNVKTAIMGGNAYGWNVIAIKNDGTVWGWGHLWSRYSAKPVQILYPAGTFVVSICQGLTLMALDTAGKVHIRYGGNQGFATQYINPQGTSTPDTLNDYILPLAHRVVRMTGASFWSAAEEDNGDIVGWGPWPGFLAYGPALDSNSQHPSPTNIPIRIDTALGFRGPLIDLKANNAGMYAITSDGKLHGWGDATQGTMGNGAHIDFSNYPNGTGTNRYAWRQSENPAELLQRKQKVVGQGIQFDSIFVSNALCYCVYCRSHGQLYAFGRNKGGQLGNGILGCDAFGIIAATYPNSWDQWWIIPVNPWTATNFGTTSPYCVGNPGGSQCSTTGCIIGSHANPMANAGTIIHVALGSMFTLDGTGSSAASGWGLNYFLWAQTGGASQPPLLPAFPQSPITASAVGIYTYQLTVTDNGWQSSTASITVIVDPAIPPDKLPHHRYFRRFFK